MSAGWEDPNDPSASGDKGPRTRTLLIVAVVAIVVSVGVGYGLWSSGSVTVSAPPPTGNLTTPASLSFVNAPSIVGNQTGATGRCSLTNSTSFFCSGSTTVAGVGYLVSANVTNGAQARIPARVYYHASGSAWAVHCYVDGTSISSGDAVPFGADTVPLSCKVASPAAGTGSMSLGLKGP